MVSNVTTAFYEMVKGILNVKIPRYRLDNKYLHTKHKILQKITENWKENISKRKSTCY